LVLLGGRLRSARTDAEGAGERIADRALEGVWTTV
jgi:hypothetical protein